MISNLYFDLKGDVSEDHFIHCFKNGHPCPIGSDLLREQLHVLMNADTLKSNPILIEPTDSDMKEANNKNNLLYQDDFMNFEDF